MAFEGFRLTDVGRALLTDALIAGDITFTHAAVGSGFWPASSPEQARTALVQYVADIPISTIETTGNQIKIRASFTNRLPDDSILPGFIWAEVGVFARLGADAETLVLYANARDAEHADYIPATLCEFTMDFTLAFDGAENINVTFDRSLVYVNRAEFEVGMDSMHFEVAAALESVAEQIAASEASVGTQLDASLTDVKDRIAASEASVSAQLDASLTDVAQRISTAEERVNTVADTVDGQLAAAVDTVNAVALTVDGKLETALAQVEAVAKTLAPAHVATITLAAAAWQGDAPPFTQTITGLDSVKDGWLVQFGVGELTLAQYEAVCRSGLIPLAPEENTVTIQARRRRPDLDLPITIVALDTAPHKPLEQ